MLSSAIEFEKQGARVKILVSSRETCGDYVICEVQSEGPIEIPRHSHTFEDQWIQVLAGEFRFDMGEESVDLRPGGTLSIPKGTACRVSAPGGGKLLVVARPGGLDLFLTDAHCALCAQAPFQPIFEKHGIVVQ
jgi:quercetin dioxygenase-like cupin family protein